MRPWYVLFTKPRQERDVRDRLAQQEIETYLPLLPPLRPAQAARPLFPRYLFARFDMTVVPVERIRWTPGLVSILMFDGKYAVVGNEVIAYLRERIAGLEARRRVPYAPGQRVRLPADHPFAKMEAIFEKPCSDAKRAYILLEALGRIVRCQVELTHLEPAEALRL